MGVAAAATVASSLHGSFGSVARRIGGPLGASAAAEAPADPGFEAHRRSIEDEARALRRAQEEAEAASEAREEDSSPLVGSIFGGPLIGTAIGSAIGSEGAISESEILAPEPSFGGDED